MYASFFELVTAVCRAEANHRADTSFELGLWHRGCGGLQRLAWARKIHRPASDTRIPGDALCSWLLVSHTSVAPRYTECPREIMNDTQLKMWEAAVEAAKPRKHQPSPSDISIPWSSHAISAEVCTIVPDPSSARVTLFVRTRLQPQELARRLNSDFLRRLTLTVKTPEKDNVENQEEGEADGQTESAKQALLVSASGERVIIVEKTPGNHTHGSVLAISSLTTETREALERFALYGPVGYACLIPHDVVEIDIETAKGAMKLVRRTGVEKKESSVEKLATIFELKDVKAPSFDMPPGEHPHRIDRDVVARCVVGYKDGSLWPCVGPTISSIAVRRDYQGCALIQDLFNSVERWFVENWWLNTLNGNRMLKGTKLADLIVDRVGGEDDAGADREFVLTDKVFFYDVMGFVANKRHPEEHEEMDVARPTPEAEALKYYPPAGSFVPLPTVNYVCWPVTGGWRSCDNCRIPEAALSGGLLVCGDCSVPTYWRAHYCSKKCQLEDWELHKLVCKKSYDEVCEGKEAFERGLVLPIFPPRQPAARKRKFLWLLK